MPPLVIRVESPVPTLPQLISSALTEAGVSASAVQRPAVSCIIKHRSTEPAKDLASVIELMRPFTFAMEHVLGLDVDAVLCIGLSGSQPLSHLKVRLCCDSAPFRDKIASSCRAVGFSVVVPPTQPNLLLGSSMQYGGAHDAARALLCWLIRRFGGDQPAQTKAWGDGDKDIYVDLAAPANALLPLRERLLVTVRADTPAAFGAIQPRLQAAGFSRITLASLSPSDDSRLRVDPGALQHLGAHVEIADITRAVADAAEELRVDWATHPLEMVDRSSPTGAGVFIEMPIAAMRSGRLSPWSRLHPGRYGIDIFDDDRAVGLALERELNAMGFRVQRRRLSKIAEGFALRCGRNVPASLQERVRSMVDTTMLRVDADDFGLSCTQCDGEKIAIELPVRAHREGRLLVELSSASRYAVKVIAHSAAVAKPLVAALKDWGFRSVRSEVDTDEDPPELQFGGAHTALLDRIAATVDSLYGAVTLARNKCWAMTDHDIFVRLPSGLAPPVPELKAHVADPAKPSRGAPPVGRKPPVRGPFVEVTEAEVRVGDIVLSRRPAHSRHQRAPSPERFRGFCTDQQVADTLHFLAMAQRGRYPAALEGPTAASKTWSISYLASLIGTGAYRLNLNAQSDVSELIGRFVPDTERASSFRWQHGPAPLAMTEGCWLIIDEADLAPSEILERTNPILETPDPQLHLSEYDGRLISADTDFRVLATWNGTLYSGRQELSPALLDRFKVRICTAPTENDYHALGECLVYGSQPQIEVHGACYRGGSDAPQLPELATAVPEFDRFLAAFARFHAGLARMADTGELRARGRIAVTRRAFVDALREMRDQLKLTGHSPDLTEVIRAAWQALSLCHLQRLDANGERDKALTLLTACGITADAWELPR